MKQTAFTRKKDFGKEAREAQWAHAQRTLHGLHPTDANQSPLPSTSNNRDLGDMAEQAKRRAEIARYLLNCQANDGWRVSMSKKKIFPYRFSWFRLLQQCFTQKGSICYLHHYYITCFNGYTCQKSKRFCPNRAGWGNWILWRGTSSRLSAWRISTSTWYNNPTPFRMFDQPEFTSMLMVADSIVEIKLRTWCLASMLRMTRYLR